jgi:hypothetical protein
MSSILGTVREYIQAQGFCGLDDMTCAQINYPLRLSPEICMVWVKELVLEQRAKKRIGKCIRQRFFLIAGAC